MKRTVFWGILIMVFAAGMVSAQSTRIGDLGLNNELGLTLDRFQAQGGQGGYQFDAEAYQKEAFAPWGAGFLNILGGLWSWQHGDTFGGALTAGLEGAGLLLAIIGVATVPDPWLPDGTANPADPTASLLMLMGGGVIFIAGGTFGFIRGMGQYNEQNAVAAGFGGNPLEKVSFNLVPGVGGSIMYSTSF